ncbi:MAG TPA: MFS transporter [Gaiellaceae bacterium]|nr:MFS transporter [Gaiellaceae bacterium]
MGLRRNRDFVLYQAGQFLSTAGSSLSSVAYPLLVLALTHSPAKAGLVSFARLLPAPCFGLFAGVVADRLDRQRVMLAADACRALTMAALAILVTQGAPYWPIVLIAFLEGTGDIFFSASSTGAIRSVVPADQLPNAIAVQQGRAAVATLVGPPAGGALFSISRALPFVGDAVSYACSFLAILAMRTRFQQPRERLPLRIRAELAEGFRFLWRQPFLRTTAIYYAVGNATIPAVLFIVVVVARGQGLSGGSIGLLLALFSAGILIGSACSASVRRRLSVRAVVLVEAYTGLLMAAYLVEPSVYVLLAAALPQAIVLPITDSYVVAHRIVATPDRLLGRVEAVRITIARTAAPLGPLAAGVLLSATTGRTTVAVFTALTAGLAVYATLARPLRHPPPLEAVA